MQGIQNCLKNKVLTGVCTSLCQTNIDDLLTERWVDRLIEMGVMYTWFHVYRPMGPNPNPDLCLTPEQARRARQFVVEMRAKKPIIIIDAYYDGEGQGPVPGGDRHQPPHQPVGRHRAVPDRAVREGIDPREGRRHAHRCARSSLSPRSCASSANCRQQTTRGCIVLERPDLLKPLVEKHAAKDSTARQTALRRTERHEDSHFAVHPGARDAREEPCSTGWRSDSGSTTSACTRDTITRRPPRRAYWPVNPDDRLIAQRYPRDESLGPRAKATFAYFLNTISPFISPLISKPTTMKLSLTFAP